jgi:lysozyme
VIPPNSPGAAFLQGIDVSHFQRSVDWTAAAAAGIHFCFIKATEGDSRVDPLFAINWRSSKLAGIARGAYHFFRPAIPVTSQANLFLRTVSRLDPDDLPPVLDLEAPAEWAPLPVADRAARALEWLEAVEQGLHRRPMVYLSPAFMSEVLHNDATLAGYPVWIAHYTPAATPQVPAPWKRWTFWQYAGTANAAGISTPVDLSRFNGTLDDLKRLG